MCKISIATHTNRVIMYYVDTTSTCSNPGSTYILLKYIHYSWLHNEKKQTKSTKPNQNKTNNIWVGNKKTKIHQPSSLVFRMS